MEIVIHSCLYNGFYKRVQLFPTVRYAIEGFESKGLKKGDTFRAKNFNDSYYPLNSGSTLRMLCDCGLIEVVEKQSEEITFEEYDSGSYGREYFVNQNGEETNPKWAKVGEVLTKKIECARPSGMVKRTVMSFFNVYRVIFDNFEDFRTNFQQVLQAIVSE